MKNNESVLFKIIAVTCVILIVLVSIFGILICAFIKDKVYVTDVSFNKNGEMILFYSNDTTSTLKVPVQVGVDGKSAYELYLETVPEGETPMTQDEWLASLKGADGTDGVDGIDGQTPTVEIGDDGNWIINGENTGVPATGADGVNGQDGAGILSATINEKGELVIVLTNDEELNLGVVVGANGQDGVDGQDGVGIESIEQVGDKLIIILTDYTVHEIDLSANSTPEIVE